MEVKLHPRYGAEILEKYGCLQAVVPMVLYHHERWDGRGYIGRRGDETPLVLMLADRFLPFLRSYRLVGLMQ